MINEAIELGKLLFQAGLIDGASGNLSFRDGEKIIITKSGASLYSLKSEDFVDIASKEASRDKAVHAKIYELCDCNAVIHCHGVFNVVLSLRMPKITPLDLEGKIYFKELKIVDEQFGTTAYAERIAEEVKRSGAAIARGHGIYSAGKNLREAFNKACYVEHSCEVLYYLEIFDKF
ncbi:MAG: class II aldolase/adducin family protein [Archaeoglobaceae archaeon]